MSQIIKCKLASAGYEVDDAIAVTDDNHQCNAHELDTYLIETNVLITDEDVSKLLMEDMQGNTSASRFLPAFQSLSTDNKLTTKIHRRKYQYNNGVLLKTNAQKG